MSTKKNANKIPSFIESDRIKARGAVAHLVERFIKNCFNPPLRREVRKRMLKEISIGTEYLFNFFELIRHEERVRAIMLMCGSCKKNIDVKPHGNRYIHSGDHGICKAWRIRNFIDNDIQRRSERIIRRMVKNKSGYTLTNLTNKLKKAKII